MPIGRLLLKSLLLSRNRKHLKQGRPRIAGFAFDHIAAKIHIDGRFEDAELAALETLVFPALPRDGLCLDIGANIGNHTVAFADCFAHVHAFEPNPNVFRLLAVNATLRGNITTWNTGLSDREGRVEVVENQLNTGGSGIGVAAGAFRGATVEFGLTPLDSLQIAAPGQRIVFTKIDVEGHEAEVLAGARETLSRHRPVIGIEVSRNSLSGGSNPALTLLRSMGYGHFYEIRRPRGLRRFLPGQSARVVPVGTIQHRNYPIFLAATEPVFG